jgi:hypothetical protein
MNNKYTVKGDVRGTISTHRTLAAAIKSADRDRKAISRMDSGGSLTRSYSDVYVYDAQGNVCPEEE